MDKADVAMIGLGVMGQNLALNMESKGFSVVGYDAVQAKTDAFIVERASGKRIVGAHTLEAVVAALEKPRKIMMMVPAGHIVDDLIAALVPLLDSGDILIDGGNSYYKDTIRRTEELESKGLLFVGAGVSGGEEGALIGPSIMPGGSVRAWPFVKPILQKIAAHIDEETPCCEWVGSDGAGHFVKMVHNGIEYSDMQLISEAYFLLESSLGLSAEQLHDVFSDWNKSELDSYLIQITAEIFSKIDTETGKPIVEVIKDVAAQKGTGMWASQVALELGVPSPTMAEAVFARYMSAVIEQRQIASQNLNGPCQTYVGDKSTFIEAIRNGLYASKICAYAQGFQLMREASKIYGWNLNLAEIAQMWREGCIIRARFLSYINEALEAHPDTENLLLTPFFKDAIDACQESWRHVVSEAVKLGIPAPAFSSALAYYDSYRRDRLPANLIQALRDYFGAHTYERIDKAGVFHTEWI